MNVVIAGEGQDVLLVHGFPDTHRVWRHVIAALVSAGYRVIAPDTRGCGQTEMPSRSDWLLFRLMTQYPEEMPEWRRALSRPGRLTAGMNYYRANLGLAAPRQYPRAQVPVLGIWSTGDLFLTETQLVESQRYVNAPWRYERIEGANHWMQLSAPEKLNPLLLEYLSPLARSADLW